MYEKKERKKEFTKLFMYIYIFQGNCTDGYACKLTTLLVGITQGKKQATKFC